MENRSISHTLLHMIAGAFVGIYGIALLFLFLFCFFWNNKGAVSIFNKSYTDWLFVFWLAISSAGVLYGSAHCFYKKSTYMPLIFFALVLGVNFIVLVIPSTENAVIDMSAIHMMAGLGFLFWVFADYFGRKKR